MQTEYQLRLKDLHLQERVKELTEKFTTELENDRQKFELLLQEKNEQEMEYEEKLKQAEERSQAQLSALDTQYQVRSGFVVTGAGAWGAASSALVLPPSSFLALHSLLHIPPRVLSPSPTLSHMQAKIMAEVERFQQLTQEKELLNERWDEQNSLLVESHERVIAELTEDYESKLAEEALKIEQLQQVRGRSKVSLNGAWRPREPSAVRKWAGLGVGVRPDRPTSLPASWFAATGQDRARARIRGDQAAARGGRRPRD